MSNNLDNLDTTCLRPAGRVEHPAMDAVIFDFDGVVVDSEPVHFAGFRDVLATLGLDLKLEDYYDKYLGYDDHDCLLIAARDRGVELSERQIADLTAAKTDLVQRAFRESIQPLPGAVTLIRAIAAAGVPMAICSGALRDEIILAGRTVGVLDCFQAIVAAQDVKRGKPDPQGYLAARSLLARAAGKDLRPRRCIVVEDSPAGIEAARAAGMKVLAVATSYRPNHLAKADRVVASLADVTFAQLQELL
jgi:beta-phosphoglucomutase